VSVVDELAALMADKGQRNYGENVTIAEHVLLTAGAAQAQGASDTLIAACLLHDVGHWLDEPDDDFGIPRPRRHRGSMGSRTLRARSSRTRTPTCGGQTLFVRR